MSRLYNILDDMADKITQDTGWTSVSNGVKYRIVKGLCIVMIESATVSQASTSFTLATLPQEARPSQNTQLFFRAGYNIGQCWCQPGGDIKCYLQDTTTAGAGFGIWPV